MNDEEQPQPVLDGLGSVMQMAATAEVIPGPRPVEVEEDEA